MAADRALLAHLYRRAGFGAVSHELDVAETRGFDATVEHLVNGLTEDDHGAPGVVPPTFLPFVQDDSGTNPLRSAELLTMTNWWLELMSSTSTPLREKLVLLLHCQFPTAYSKVDVPSLLFAQNQLFRRLGHGGFDKLTTAVSKDPAMLIWLDAGTDLVAHPNENFARELMERFTMGIGTYNETDVKQAARAFTGWALDYQTGQYEFNPSEHDYGEKTVLGHTATMFGEQVIDVVTHTSASAHWVVSRLWSWLAYPVYRHDPVVAELVPGYAADLHVGNLVKAILNHPMFVSTAAQRGLVKMPVEYVVGALRAFELGPASFPAGYLMSMLTSLGQQLFNPPTVGGWGDNQYWLSTATSLNQLNFATEVAKVADLSTIDDEPLRGRVEAMGDLLGITTWSAGTNEALKAVSAVPASLATLALVSPEYVSN